MITLVLSCRKQKSSFDQTEPRCLGMPTLTHPWTTAAARAAKYQRWTALRQLSFVGQPAIPMALSSRCSLTSTRWPWLMLTGKVREPTPVLSLTSSSGRTPLMESSPSLQDLANASSSYRTSSSVIQVSLRFIQVNWSSNFAGKVWAWVSWVFEESCLLVQTLLWWNLSRFYFTEDMVE